MKNKKLVAKPEIQAAIAAQPLRNFVRSPWFKVLLMLSFLVLGVCIVAFTPIGGYITDLEYVQAQIKSAGFVGILIFIAIVVVAALLNIPGTAFLVLAILIYGTLEGAILSYVAAIIATVTSFYFGRLIGGGALSRIKNQWVKRLIANAERNPVRTIVILRIFMQLSPLISYSLALTEMKAKRFIIGNMIGLLVPIAYIGLAMYFIRDTVMQLLGVS
jgi:uncharacterized membrane protein YdjX (TVP38/TMEM64 family)